jgi:two-component system response regulator YesN
MNQNYDSDLSLQEIAGKVFLTPNYFAGIFKEKTGMTVMDCLTDIRMQKAKELLANTHLKSHEIAIRVGYADTKYFGQVFRKLTGHTPLEYREIVLRNN